MDLGCSFANGRLAEAAGGRYAEDRRRRSILNIRARFEARLGSTRAPVGSSHECSTRRRLQERKGRGGMWVPLHIDGCSVGGEEARERGWRRGEAMVRCDHGKEGG
jgi:hypothetical protein